jgi:hypothetical protein
MGEAAGLFQQGNSGGEAMPEMTGADQSRWDKGTAEFTRDGNRKLLLLLFVSIVILGGLFWGSMT